MPDLVFADTNVLVYARDAGQAEKHARAAAWMRYLWTTRSGRLSPQVLQEFYLTVTTKLRPGMTKADARREVRDLFAWRPAVLGLPEIEGAWVAQDRFGLSWWDALIVSAARVARCRVLLTEDLQDGQELDELRVVNPFTHEPPVAAPARTALFSRHEY
jgi:predicted nucleic acid-binding protein